MRLFLAIRLDKEMNKAITFVLHDLKAGGVTGKFTPSQNLHMTLTFIGETDKLKEIKEAVAAVPVPTMRIAPDRLTLYGNILVAEMKGNQKLKEYVADVRSALDAAGIEYDRKKFRPHITLVRKAGGSFKGVAFPRAVMTVSHVSLMKSVQRDGKIAYTEVVVFGK